MGATDLSRLSRRDFLKNGFVFGAGAAGLAAGYAAVPDVFARAVYGGKLDGVMNDRVLVKVPGNEGERRSRGGILIPATAEIQ